MIRDLPIAVSRAGWPATVLTPSYGVLHEIPGRKELEPVAATFRGGAYDVRVFDVPGNNTDVRYVVFDHPLLAPTDPGVVYHGDVPSRPYATDASKFAFFSAAVAAWIESQPGAPAALHLHDWHVAVLAVLRAFDPALTQLQASQMYFTIHNLSYQGQRPLADDESSLEEWFPELQYDADVIGDPTVPEVFNPMAAAIRLSDRINAVSPTYADEIQQPSDPDGGFIGGEGLEEILQQRAREGDLIGILNGCDYSRPAGKAPSWQKLLDLCTQTLEGWDDDEANDIALETIARRPKRRPLHLLTSVGRVVDQKMRLMFQGTDSSSSALEGILKSLGKDSLMILLGSGEARYEAQLVELARNYSNFLYVRGYSEAIGDALYSSGDLFLMPSSFEPCGISQMLAMRCGQPCVAHGVGGLRDTIDDGVNGFIFDGHSPREQAQGFVECVIRALWLRLDDPLHWKRIRDNARAARFEWSDSASAYIKEFYGHRSR